MSIPDHQLSAYQSMYELENTLRVVLHNYLSRKYGDNYFRSEFFIPFKDSISEKPLDIVKYIESKVSAEKRLLGKERGVHDIWFLDYSILVLLIKHHWGDDICFATIFEDLDEAERDYMIKRLLNLVEIRNDIAHNRIVNRIGANDIESVLKDLMNYIKGEYLEDNDIVMNRDNIELLKELISILEGLIFALERMEIAKLSRLISIRHTLAITMSQNDYSKIFGEIEVLIEILKNYNTLRRPNASGIIKDYLNEKQLTEKIDELIRKIMRIKNGYN